MRVVALVSGGKDSCFSIHLCEQHGHQVVALANLLPPDSNTDELDSYMYQTVGHQLVAAYASCTGLPLYRQRITGCSNSQDLSYSVTSGDEVEDLYRLLAYIKEHHPEVQAVASGAIASDYQRMRVENVCSRLDLVSLAYLWHQPQDKLLSDMIANGISAVLVKVAAIGLDPHKHLGKSIQQLQPLLRKLRDQFGCNVCGEGGEYETLTLDCPAFRFGRIVLDDWQVVLHSPDSIAAVGVLHPTAFHVEPKQHTAHTSSISGSTPALAQQQQQQQSGASQVIEVPVDWQPRQTTMVDYDADQTQQQPQQKQEQWDTDVQVLESPEHLQVICSVSAAAATDEAAVTVSQLNAADTASALGAALKSITTCLSILGLNWNNSLFVHLYLADMTQFTAANDEYCRHLPQVNPPSRACVQVPLPAGCPVLLDVLMTRPTTANSMAGSIQSQQQQQQLARRVLHVQSISSWAPSCIGPYSQATCCNGLIYMAGQIPLDPASMTVIQSASTSATANSSSGSSSSPPQVTHDLIAHQVWRTLRSCQAVAVAMRSCVATASLALTVYLTDECAAAGGQAVVQAALQEMWRDRRVLEQQEVPQTVLSAAAAAADSIRSGSTDQCAAEDSVNDKSIATTDQITGPSAAAGDLDDDCNGSDGEDHESDSGHDVIDEYLQPPDVSQAITPDVLFVTVPALPRGALLELQPILVDVAAAQQATLSSSGSEDPSDKCGVKACDDLAACHLADLPAAERCWGDQCTNGAQPETDSSRGDGVLCRVSPAAASKESGSSCGWTRVLLHLPKDNAPADNGSKQAAQIAAAVSKMSAALASGSSIRQRVSSTVEHQDAQQAVSMVRCYYQVCSPGGSDTDGVAGQCRIIDVSSLHSTLHQHLRQLLAAQHQQHKVAVQCVPVRDVASSASQGMSCWSIIEVLLRQ